MYLIEPDLLAANYFFVCKVRIAVSSTFAYCYHLVNPISKAVLHYNKKID